MAPRFSKEDSRAIIEHCSTKTRNSPRRANKILNPVPENPAFSGLQEILNSFLQKSYRQAGGAGRSGRLKIAGNNKLIDL